MDNSDTQLGPLIEVFELYMLHDADLADMREPITVAAHAMLDAGLSRGMILSVIDGAVQVAAMGARSAEPAVPAQELRNHLGQWLMETMFDPSRIRDDDPQAA